jgi:ubiquinone/menaquinone biosynthesis C-methylase UbiE
MSDKPKSSEFWDSNPCCGNWSSIDGLISWRNKSEPYVKKVLDKVVIPDKKILEVGCGQGIEFVQNLEKGMDMTGLDYSKDSIAKTKKHITQKFKYDKNNGKFPLLRGDAENLPFQDSLFDIVYSIGVLHHTPNTQKAINEIHRVLKNDGMSVVMLYHKLSWRSFPIASARFLSKFLDKITGKDRLIYSTLLKKYSKNLDSFKGTTMLELFGCPILKMYTKDQMKKMFSKFSSVEIECYSSNLSQLTYLFPIKPLRSFLAKIDKRVDNTLGFHLVAICKK